jgi:hypothetical protein
MFLTTDDTDIHRWLTHRVGPSDEAMDTKSHEWLRKFAERSALLECFLIRVPSFPWFRRCASQVSLRSVVVKKKS